MIPSAQTIALTIGDVNGIGPEVVLKALRAWRPPEGVRVVVISPLPAWEYWQQHLDLALPLTVVEDPAQWPAPPGVFLHPLSGIPIHLTPGQGTVQSGAVAGGALMLATAWARDGLVQAIVTAPVSKLALAQAGYSYPGQTEFLAERLEAASFAMMLLARNFRVALVTTHLPVQEIPAAITTAGILDKLRVLDRDLRERFRIAQPRVAVTGLNPHAGEGGHLGEEEEILIRPALAAAQREGIRAEGPFSADALFAKVAQPGEAGVEYDAYLAMYHDQGLIPLKMYGFGRAVNYTAGLPVIRTSPDHGTAYDIAGLGVARPGSMNEALQLAAGLLAHQ